MVMLKVVSNVEKIKRDKLLFAAYKAMFSVFLPVVIRPGWSCEHCWWMLWEHTRTHQVSLQEGVTLKTTVCVPT